MARTYNQECVLAYALDLLGERWTLLMIRNLFLGPQRFGDLQAGLPGIGANLLSKRLKEMDEAGLITAPGESETRGKYKLTPEGEALRPDHPISHALVDPVFREPLRRRPHPGIHQVKRSKPGFHGAGH